jgi:predicted nucleic acid-binding protein
LLEFSGRAQRALLTFIADGAIELVSIEGAEVRRAEALMLKYEDLPMDFADSTVVVLGEMLGTVSVFTLDRKDFGIYRIGRRKFDLLPRRP